MSSQLKGLAADAGRTDPSEETAPAHAEAAETPAPVDTGREEDWGIAPPRSGLSRETKMGFAFVLVLLVVFGFVVYKKIEQGRAERGDLLAGAQEAPASPDGATPDSAHSAHSGQNAENAKAKNQPSPEQNFNQFPEPTPAAAPSELTPASWDQQSFEPPPQQEVVNTPPAATPGTPSQSLEQFPVENQTGQEFAPPVETAASSPFPPEQTYQTTAEPESQTTMVAVPPGSETNEFAPPTVPENESFTQTSTPGNEAAQTPVPDNEFAQAPSPQGFEPPTDSSNPPVPEDTPVAAQGTESENAGGNPFAVGDLPEQAEPAPSGTEFENEQFSAQSQPLPQEFAQPPVQETVETPPAGNPFGGLAPTEPGQAGPPENAPTQTPPAAMGNDPFASTQITEAAPSAPVERIPVQNAPPTIPEQTEPARELAQPNPLPVQGTDLKQLPVANHQNLQDLGAVPTGSQHEPAMTGDSPLAQHPVDAAPQEFAENSFGPVPAPARDAAQVYVVRPGDNYWKISKEQYGTVRYFSALARYNQQRIVDPKKMRPGMKILTPTREVLESQYPDLFPQFAAKAADVSNVDHRADEKSGFYVNAQGQPMYRVGQNDTLGGIAQKHLGRFSRWTEIYRLNRHRLKNPNALTLGDLLVLPPDASRVNMVQHASGVR